MTTWDGTAKSVSDALQRFAAGTHTEADWSLMTDVVGAAMSASELRNRMARLEALGADNDLVNENKRLKDRVVALEVEARELVERLEGG